GKKMEKTLARKKGVGLKDRSKKPEKSPGMMNQNRGFIYRLHTATQHERYLHFHLSMPHRVA
ncbi:MAG: hypothetical protein ACTTJ7_06900, partial [Treponema sp.]